MSDVRQGVSPRCVFWAGFLAQLVNAGALVGIFLPTAGEASIQDAAARALAAALVASVNVYLSVKLLAPARPPEPVTPITLNLRPSGGEKRP